MRVILSSLLTVTAFALHGQLFTGVGGELRIPSADRLVATQSALSQIGYQSGDLAVVGQFRIPSSTTHWTQPNWFSGARLEWSAYEISTDSIPLSFIKNAEFQVVASGQWSKTGGHRFVSEHLGGFEVDHWTREIYQFQYGNNEFLVGLGLQGRFGSWSALAEVQYGPGARLDTWVYKSQLMNTGAEQILEDYYYFERFNIARLSFTLRKHLNF
jgi:hypothetical protein